MNYININDYCTWELFTHNSMTVPLKCCTEHENMCCWFGYQEIGSSLIFPAPWHYLNKKIFHMPLCVKGNTFFFHWKNEILRKILLKITRILALVLSTGRSKISFLVVRLYWNNTKLTFDCRVIQLTDILKIAEHSVTWIELVFIYSCE